MPLGTTAFVSGKNMFEALTPALKSVAVRSRVKYAPHCFVWMAPAHAHSTGLGMETEGLELPMNELPPWEEAKMQTLPVVSAQSLPHSLHADRANPALEECCHGQPPCPTILVWSTRDSDRSITSWSESGGRSAPRRRTSHRFKRSSKPVIPAPETWHCTQGTVDLIPTVCDQIMIKFGCSWCIHMTGKLRHRYKLLLQLTPLKISGARKT